MSRPIGDLGKLAARHNVKKKLVQRLGVSNLVEMGDDAAAVLLKYHPFYRRSLAGLRKDSEGEIRGREIAYWMELMGRSETYLQWINSRMKRKPQKLTAEQRSEVARARANAVWAAKKPVQSEEDDALVERMIAMAFRGRR